MKKNFANYTILINKEKRLGTNEDCYVALVPVLGIATDADSLEQVQKEIESLVKFHIECLADEGQEIPLESLGSFVTKFQTDLPSGITGHA